MPPLFSETQTKTQVEQCLGAINQAREVIRKQFHFNAKMFFGIKPPGWVHELNQWLHQATCELLVVLEHKDKGEGQ